MYIIYNLPTLNQSIIPFYMIHHSFLIDNTMEKNCVFFYINDKSYLVFLHSFIHSLSHQFIYQRHISSSSNSFDCYLFRISTFFFLLCFIFVYIFFLLISFFLFQKNNFFDERKLSSFRTRY